MNQTGGNSPSPHWLSGCVSQLGQILKSVMEDLIKHQVKGIKQRNGVELLVARFPVSRESHKIEDQHPSKALQPQRQLQSPVPCDDKSYPKTVQEGTTKREAVPTSFRPLLLEL